VLDHKLTSGSESHDRKTLEVGSVGQLIKLLCTKKYVMRTLTAKENTALQRAIENYRRKSKAGWFGNKVKNDFMEQLIVSSPSQQESRHDVLRRFLKLVESLLSTLGLREVIVFPEPGWELPEGWGFREAAAVMARELRTLVGKIEFGLTNYYIIPHKDMFSWIITLCHEGDFHACGTAEFIAAARNLLNQSSYSGWLIHYEQCGSDRD